MSVDETLSLWLTVRITQFIKSSYIVFTLSAETQASLSLMHIEFPRMQQGHSTKLVGEEVAGIKVIQGSKQMTSWRTATMKGS